MVNDDMASLGDQVKEPPAGVAVGCQENVRGDLKNDLAFAVRVRIGLNNLTDPIDFVPFGGGKVLVYSSGVWTKDGLEAAFTHAGRGVES